MGASDSMMHSGISLLPHIPESLQPGNAPPGPLTAIDYVLRKARRVHADLVKHGTHRYPFAIHKGSLLKHEAGKEVKAVTSDKEEKSVRTKTGLRFRAGRRMYFFDLETTKETGQKYLKITESLFKGEGQDHERKTILVFPEAVREFAEAVSGIAAKIG